MPKEGGAVRAPARIRQRSENLQPDRYGAEWAVVEPMVPPAKPGGRERTIDVREILNGAVDRLPMAGAAQRPAAEEHSMGLFPSMLTDLLRRGLRLVNVFATCGGERSGRLRIVWRHVAKTRPGPRNDDRRNKRNLVLPAL
jgi:transposase